MFKKTHQQTSSGNPKRYMSKWIISQYECHKVALTTDQINHLPAAKNKKTKQRAIQKRIPLEKISLKTFLQSRKETGPKAEKGEKPE